MRPFELLEAINGAELVTRDGHSARLICYNRKSRNKRAGRLIALVLGRLKRFERIIQYDEMGRQINFCKDLDLFLKD